MMVGIEFAKDKVLHLKPEVANLLMKNPYKYPRPFNVPSTIQNGDKKEPAIEWTFTMGFIYDTCLPILIKSFMQSLPASKIESCLGHATGKELRVGFWRMQVTLTCTKDLSMMDAESLLKSTDRIHDYFSIEIISAAQVPKPEPNKPPLQTSRRSLQRDMTKSK